MKKTKYNDNFPLLAEGLARRGLNDKEIARSLGVAESSYYSYQKEHLEFLEAIKRGKAPINEEVENILLKRIRGIDYTETETKYKYTLTSKDEKPLRIKTHVKKIKKTVPPDVPSIHFFLRNRMPDRYNVSDNVDLTLTRSLSIEGMKKNIKAAGEDGSK